MDLVRQNISSISFWGSWKSTWTEEGPQHSIALKHTLSLKQLCK